MSELKPWVSSWVAEVLKGEAPAAGSPLMLARFRLSDTRVRRVMSRNGTRPIDGVNTATFGESGSRLKVVVNSPSRPCLRRTTPRAWMLGSNGPSIRRLPSVWKLASLGTPTPRSGPRLSLRFSKRTRGRLGTRARSCSLVSLSTSGP